MISWVVYDVINFPPLIMASILFLFFRNNYFNYMCKCYCYNHGKKLQTFWKMRGENQGYWIVTIISKINPVLHFQSCSHLLFYFGNNFFETLVGFKPVTLKRRGTDRIVHMGPFLCMSRGARALTTPLCQLHGCLWLTYLQLLQVVSLALAIATSSIAYQPLWLVALSSHSSGRRK